MAESSATEAIPELPDTVSLFPTKSANTGNRQQLNSTGMYRLQTDINNWMLNALKNYPNENYPHESYSNENLEKEDANVTVNGTANGTAKV